MYMCIIISYALFFLPIKISQDLECLYVSFKIVSIYSQFSETCCLNSTISLTK